MEKHCEEAIDRLKNRFGVKTATWKQVDDNPEWWESQMGEYRYSKARSSWGYRMAGWGTEFVGGFESGEQAKEKLIEAYRRDLEAKAAPIDCTVVDKKEYNVLKQNAENLIKIGMLAERMRKS
jgi:hypothetical protein